MIAAFAGDEQLVELFEELPQRLVLDEFLDKYN